VQRPGVSQEQAGSDFASRLLQRRYRFLATLGIDYECGKTRNPIVRPKERYGTVFPKGAHPTLDQPGGMRILNPQEFRSREVMGDE
jgi:hypothetical protein